MYIKSLYDVSQKCYIFHMNRFVPILFSGLCACLAATGSEAVSPIAEVICSPTGEMHSKLERQYASRRAATGLRGREQIMEVWTDRRGDWTLVITYASGTSCIVAMGEDWASLPEKDPA